MKKNNSASLAVTDKMTIHGSFVQIELKKIIGYGNGKRGAAHIEPYVPCLIVPDGNSYQLLNAENPYLHNLLSVYNGKTNITAFLISDRRERDQIQFITGELLPHTSPQKSYNKFFTELAASPEKQRFVLDYFCSRRSQKGALFSFNLKLFLDLLGANAPSKSSILNYVKPQKIKITPPEQLDENSDAYAGTDSTATNEQKTRSDDDEQDNAVTYKKVHGSDSGGSTPSDMENYNLPKDATPSLGKPSGKGANAEAEPDVGDYEFDVDDGLKDVWSNYANSEHTIDEIIQRLMPNGRQLQREFIRGLKHRPDSPTFTKFILSVNEFMRVSDFNEKFDISNEFKDIWRKNSKSHYKIESIVEMLRQQRIYSQEKFLKHIKLNPFSDEFKEAIKLLEKYMDGLKNGR